tara:strand:- start:517 stop:1203 length:687 start_codon:yes stop_codon:yes gene_type:complete
MLLEIVFEHADWLVAIKPAGLNFHSEDGESGFVALLEKQLDIKLWPVHRLDKLTSGLLLVAKSKQSCSVLSQLFSQRQIEKYYLAVCPSSMKKKQGLVKGDMTQGRRGGFKLLKTSDNPAITQFFSCSLQPGLRLVLLKPLTGKTHQLRVAMKSIGAPIVGDSLYSPDAAERLYLHSFVLKFKYTDEEFCFAQLPQADGLFNIEDLIENENWRTPWLLTWPSLSKNKT